MSRFADHFSVLADGYARYRPGYPPSLFAWLAGLAPARRLAWDCATGSGQAAVALGRHFERVAATEASLDQLLQADRRSASASGVGYVRSLAERSGLASGTADLVTVAQALHWLDFDTFWPEVRRVLVPGGVMAAWGYDLLTVDPDPGERVRTVLRRYYREVVGDYWPPERRLTEQRYRTVSFPFEEIRPPEVISEAQWTREHFFGYLGTWSAGKRYLEARGEDPRDRIAEELTQAWPETESRTVRWQLFVRVGRTPV